MQNLSLKIIDVVLEREGQGIKMFLYGFRMGFIFVYFPKLSCGILLVLKTIEPICRMQEGDPEWHFTHPFWPLSSSVRLGTTIDSGSWLKWYKKEGRELPVVQWKQSRIKESKEYKARERNFRMFQAIEKSTKYQDVSDRG